MRGQITYGCYKQMEVMDCVASNKEEYVDIALRLATNPYWRKHVRQKIISNRHKIFEDAKAVEEFELFFENIFGCT